MGGAHPLAAARCQGGCALDDPCGPEEANDSRFSPLDLVASEHVLCDGSLHADGGALAIGPQGRPTGSRQVLLEAVQRDDAPRVLQLVAEDADIAMMGEALRLASLKGSCNVARELIAVGLGVSAPCPRAGLSAVQLASLAGHVAICELLLDALADVHGPAAPGSSPQALAREMGNTEICEVIERHISLLGAADDEEGAQQHEQAQYRRAHVLPRLSPEFSEAVVRAATMGVCGTWWADEPGGRHRLPREDGAGNQFEAVTLLASDRCRRPVTPPGGAVIALDGVTEEGAEHPQAL